METWPASLPQSVLLQYNLEPVSGLLSIDEYRNPTRNRTYSEWKAEFRMIVSGTELAIFKTFFKTTINQSGLFTVPWLADIGFTFHVVRFLSAGPSFESTSAVDKWVLVLPLEILPTIESDSDGYNPYPPSEDQESSFAYQDTDGASLIWQDTDDGQDKYLTV